MQALSRIVFRAVKQTGEWDAIRAAFVLTVRTNDNKF